MDRASAQIRAEVRVDTRDLVHKIDPRIYGQFVEHFGRIVNGGLWAELLQNRKFYPIDPNREHLADPWKPERDQTSVSYGIDRSVTLTGISAQRVLLFGESREWRGIHQTGFDVLGGKEYVAYAWIKTGVPDQAVSFRLESPAGEVAAHAETALHSAGWQKYEVRLKPDKDLHPAVFRIAFNASGLSWIGAASLMPADNVEGMRRDVLELVKSMGPTIIRWPGGGFPDSYDWRKAVGMRDRRVPQDVLLFGQPFGYDHGMDPCDFGTDEYLRFCELVGAEPYITVNFGTGTPEMAAAWVEYCNGPPDSPWGSKRASNGHPKPYGVKHWSIGNEIWLPVEPGHTNAQGYATYMVPIARAMRASDPDIQITCVGDLDNEPPDAGWNQAVLSAAWKEVDLLSLHHYYPGGFWKPALLDHPIEAYKALVGEPVMAEKKIQKAIALADRITAGQKQVQIAMDEWSEWDWDYSPPVDRPERSAMNQFIDLLNKSGLEFNQTLRDALFGARMLHVYMRLGDRIPIAVRTHMINSLGTIRTDSTRSFKTVPGEMMELYRMHSGPTFLKSEANAPTFDVPEEGWTNIPYLDAVATLSADGKTLFIHLLNLHPDQAMNVSLHIAASGVDPQGEVWQIASDDFMSRNDFGKETVAITHRRAEGLGREFTQTLPAHSAMTLELRLQ
jgi:alpha-N-arabinofuranosidase